MSVHKHKKCSILKGILYCYFTLPFVFKHFEKERRNFVRLFYLCHYTLLLCYRRLTLCSDLYLSIISALISLVKKILSFFPLFEFITIFLLLLYYQVYLYCKYKLASLQRSTHIGQFPWKSIRVSRKIEWNIIPSIFIKARSKFSFLCGQYQNSFKNFDQENYDSVNRANSSIGFLVKISVECIRHYSLFWWSKDYCQ